MNRSFFYSLPFLFFSFVMCSCDDDIIDDPCAEWWVGIELDEGIEWLDVDADSVPEGITYIDGDALIEVVCDDSDDDDCIPDCLEDYMDGIADFDEDDEVEGDDEPYDGDDVDDEDVDDVDDPCEEWWVGLDWIDGVELGDMNEDGIPDVLYVIAGDELITVLCDGDLDGDCIPDCFEDYLL